nr:hypothetical protein [Desulfobulbaceae bacterium]
MVFERELARINTFIDNFDPQEFTTKTDHLAVAVVDKELRKLSAGKIKTRIQKKRQLKQKFKTIEFSDDYDASDVLVSQEQIDELLNELQN